MDGRYPIFRERGGETRLGRCWGVARTDWNGLYHTHGVNTRNQIGTQLHSQVRGGAEGADSGRAILIASLSIRSVWAGGGVGRTVIDTASQYQYWCPTGEESYQGNIHVLHSGLHGIGGRGVYPPQGRDFHPLDIGSRV